MSVGFVVIVHTALDRAAAVARHWAEAGCPGPRSWPCDSRWPGWPMCASAPATAANGAPGPSCGPRWRRSSWRWPPFPRSAMSIWHRAPACRCALRPAADLTACLAARPETDVFESVTADEAPWAMGGLSTERLSLSFPFAWKRHRRVFDCHVALPRRLGGGAPPSRRGRAASGLAMVVPDPAHADRDPDRSGPAPDRPLFPPGLDPGRKLSPEADAPPRPPGRKPVADAVAVQPAGAALRLLRRSPAAFASVGLFRRPQDLARGGLVLRYLPRSGSAVARGGRARSGAARPDADGGG